MTRYSDEWSSSAGYSAASSQREVRHMLESIRKESRSGTAIIAVVQEESVKDLKDKCALLPKKFWRGSSSVCVTSDYQLNRAVARIKSFRESPTIWVILASGLVSEISFDLKAKFEKLKILRVNSLNPDDDLLVNGASTINGTRLDEWQMKRRKQQIWIDPSIRILLNNFGDGSWYSASTDSFTYQQRGEMRASIQQMYDTSMKGNWWQQWKGPVAVLAGLGAGTAKALASLKVSATGMYVAFNFGAISIKAGGGSLTLLAFAKAAAPPIMLGFGVAAAVYYIPWDRFFNWLGSIFAGFWEWIKGLFNQLRSKFSAWNESQPRRPHNYQPM